MNRPRSAAQAAASRINGARSRGPVSTTTRAVVAHNALKHGLFCSPARRSPDLQGQLDSVVAELRQRGSTGLDALLLETALLAAARLVEATAMAARFREEMAQMLASGWSNGDDFDALVVQLRRITRYQRRFRGQRDRALRKLSTPAPEGAAIA